MIDVRTFEDKYYFFYINEIPDDVLTTDENIFFGDIQEKLDYVTDDPEEDRQYGYITPAEYIEWLKEKMRDLPGNN